jgi:hypothetical protein
MSEKRVILRVGPPEVIAKIDDVFTVQVTLNGSPDSMWIGCYRYPTDTDNESKPHNCKGHKIAFFSVESELEKT